MNIILLQKEQIIPLQHERKGFGTLASLSTRHLPSLAGILWPVLTQLGVGLQASSAVPTASHWWSIPDPGNHQRVVQDYVENKQDSPLQDSLVFI